ncbi:acyloxyacyl hydrolase [Bowmanella dokdonensis]|uniref:Lipid A deacylase n=1 Tax=Bowmanella dokdonensis TaxID=751969 RepID=A0A939DPC6_9ALTE|nr:acyloxyacyl hydrolase [Bowmanella dokdonensis]MBN7826208.1 acyloxyacyl hydrolase [Bowmanella dokdonensis]
MKHILILLFLLTAVLPSSTQADQAVALDLLLGEGDLTGLRLAYRPYHLPVGSIDWLGEVEVYFEFSANFWEYGADNHHDTNLALALSPVISQQFTTLYGRPLKWEFGIGVSLVEDTRFAGKDIGSHYQFEDRLGLVLVLEDQESVTMRYMHYSNGGLNDNNPGMDFLNLSYALRF